MVAAGEFLEHAQVFDNYYGDAAQPVDEALDRGQDLHPRDRLAGRAAGPPRDAGVRVTIFVLPPSRAELERRLRDPRRPTRDEVIARRLRDAVADMAHWREFDYVVVNDDFDARCATCRRSLRGDAADTCGRPGRSCGLARAPAGDSSAPEAAIGLRLPCTSPGS